MFESDRVQLLQRQVTAHKKARRVTAKTQCLICQEVLRAPASGKENVHVCVFECGHCYHLPCLEEKTRMWKRSDLSDGADLRSTLGCFVCDHSTRTFARTGGANSMPPPEATGFAAQPPMARGVSENQLQRAKDKLTYLMAP